jgi:outer membrane biosynthesis protein TonB
MRKSLFVISLIVLTSLLGVAIAQQKPEQNPAQKVEQKPDQKAEQKPAQKPEPKPEQKPEQKAEQKADESAQATKILTGDVVTVDATKNEIVIKNDAGTEVHLSIAASTTFFKGDKAIALADVKVGDKLTCECEKPGEGCTAKSIVVTPPAPSQ